MSDGRRIFVGDLQGCLRQLDKLLQTVALTPRDQLFCVGDLVNRGPDSLGVLRRLRDIGARTVLGNHDLYLLRIAAGRAEAPPGHPLRAVVDAADAAELLAWLGRQPILHVEENLVVVHAGLHPAWKDLPAIARRLNAAVAAHVHRGGDPDIELATHVRYCDASGRLPAVDDPPPGPPFLPWDHFYTGPRTVVFGHWARRGLVVGRWTRGLDSGCVYGNPLSAWIAEEDQIVQV